MRAILITAVVSLTAAAAPLAEARTRDADALALAVRPKLAKAEAQAHELKLAGIARTSVERRTDEATAALGFLCGIQPGEGRTGAAAARGYDPHGRFLGAKLSFAFR